MVQYDRFKVTGRNSTFGNESSSNFQTSEQMVIACMGNYTGAVHKLPVS